MKRITAIMLLLGVCFGLFGCGQEQRPAVSTEPTEYTGYRVAQPMQYPDYTFDHEPTADELRQMAVKAMADELSVEWCVDRYFKYNKTSTGSEKDFTFIPNNTYGGLPYTNADGSIIQWFEFYDTETGLLNIQGNTQQMNDLVGNTCAGSVCAAWTVVCDSITGYCGTGNMVPSHGFIPVGGYQIPQGLTDYNSYSTAQILEDNGKEVMFAAYAQILPADALTSTPDVHAIMAIEPAHVEYKASGAIDPDKSYVAIQDQRMGFYNVEKEGYTQYCNGRLYAEYTFAELWSLGYIPLTTAEFLGNEPYTPPVVSFENGVITSNYPIAMAKMMLIDNEGNEWEVERLLLTKRDIASGVARSLPLSNFMTSTQSQSFKDLLEEGKTYTLCYRVTVSNAQTFDAYKTPV